MELVRDPALRARLAAAAPGDAKAWTATAMAERLLELYRSVAAPAVRRPYTRPVLEATEATRAD